MTTDETGGAKCTVKNLGGCEITFLTCRLANKCSKWGNRGRFRLPELVVGVSDELSEWVICEWDCNGSLVFTDVRFFYVLFCTIRHGKKNGFNCFFSVIGLGERARKGESTARSQINFNWKVFFLIKSINGSINTRRKKSRRKKGKMRKQITWSSEASSRTTTDASRIMSIIAAYFN